MAKLTLAPITNLQNETTVVSTINANNDLIESALENTLSRDGLSPNTMTTPLDMNSKAIINLPSPTSLTSPLRLGDSALVIANGVGMPVGGTIDQVLSKNSGSDYDVSWKNVLAGRVQLSADLTMWVRSDGNDSHDGLSNTAGGAKLTWNALYTAATLLDFNGHTVTLKSGTTGTYNSGLFMNLAWTGGGGLIIDLNGSSINETTTKGIINNVVQPGRITIKNSAGLGVGGVIASTGFAGVQNSAPSIIEIGSGITFGTCFDAGLEATQGGTIALGFPIYISGTGGNSFALASFGSTIGFNAQTVTFQSDPTYTVGFAQAVNGASIIADAIPFVYGGHTVTGPKFKVGSNGFIYTANAGLNYLPGTTNSYSMDSSGGYDNRAGFNFLTGGQAANSTVTVSSTSNAAPSGDTATISASNVYLGANTGPSSILLGNPGTTWATEYFSGSTSGYTGLRGPAVGSGTLILPAATDTLVGKNTVDTLLNKNITVAAANGNTLQVPYFSANLSANQSITSNVTTKLQINTELTDIYSWYDNATNYRFNPQVAGKYRIFAHVSMNGTNLTEVDLTIRKNGTTHAESFNVSSAVSALSLDINKIIDFNGSSDYVEIYGLGIVSAGSVSVLGGTAPIRTWFEAQYVGP